MKANAGKGGGESMDYSTKQQKSISDHDLPTLKFYPNGRWRSNYRDLSNFF